MARVTIEQAFPFTSWDAMRKIGRSDDSIKVTLYLETAPSKAGFSPFIVEETYNDIYGKPATNETRYSDIKRALKGHIDAVHLWARESGWTPEGEGGPITQRFNVDIDLDNDAFQQEQGTEIARILRNLADDFDLDGTARGRYDATLFDCNGNRCGTAKINVKGG